MYFALLEYKLCYPNLRQLLLLNGLAFIKRKMRACQIYVIDDEIIIRYSFVAKVILDYCLINDQNFPEFVYSSKSNQILRPTEFYSIAHYYSHICLLNHVSRFQRNLLSSPTVSNVRLSIGKEYLMSCNKLCK